MCVIQIQNDQAISTELPTSTLLEQFPFLGTDLLGCSDNPHPDLSDYNLYVKGKLLASEKAGRFPPPLLECWLTKQKGLEFREVP